MKRNKGNVSGQNRRWRENNRHKIFAHNKLTLAIMCGKIKRPDICSICNNRGLIVAHHHDYALPLDVIWICYTCHNKIHNNYRKGD